MSPLPPGEGDRSDGHLSSSVVYAVDKFTNKSPNLHSFSPSRLKKRRKKEFILFLSFPPALKFLKEENKRNKTLI